MPDILIRGMEMPENCDKCIYSGWSNFYQIYVCNAVRKEEPILFDRKQVKSTAVARSGRADNCSLHELHPHGDLIDRSKIKFSCASNAPEDLDYAYRYAIDRMHVIVPANKEETP